MKPQFARPECLDKHRLTEEIRLSINTVIALNNRELEAVIVGSFAGLPAIKAELVEARKRKESLLEEYYTHVREHGC